MLLSKSKSSPSGSRFDPLFFLNAVIRIWPPARVPTEHLHPGVLKSIVINRSVSATGSPKPGILEERHNRAIPYSASGSCQPPLRQETEIGPVAQMLRIRRDDKHAFHANSIRIDLDFDAVIAAFLDPVNAPGHRVHRGYPILAVQK